MRAQKTPVVADLDQLRSWGWSDKQIVQAAIDVRYETIKGLTPEHQPRLETWLPIFLNNPDGWRFLVTAQSTPVGMWHFISLTPSAFAAMVGGRLTHSKITLAMTRSLQEKVWHDIYIVTACLKSQYWLSESSLRLSQSFFQVLIELAERQVFVGDICANLRTKYGQALNKGIGLRHVGDSETEGQMHAGHFPDLLNVRRRMESRWPRLLRLREIYSRLATTVPEPADRKPIS